VPDSRNLGILPAIPGGYGAHSSRHGQFIVLGAFLSALTAFSGFRGCRRKYDCHQIDFRVRPFRADGECLRQTTESVGTNFAHSVARRILSAHYWPVSDSEGPSWLTFIGHMKDSLWNCDLFRCESATLRTHWVLVVMDQFTRRIIGFAVHRGIVDGVALVPDVPACDSREQSAQIPQLGP